MLEPLTIEVTPHQEEMLRAGGELLISYGFNVEPFGPRTYLLRAVPALRAPLPSQSKTRVRVSALTWINATVVEFAA